MSTTIGIRRVNDRILDRISALVPDQLPDFIRENYDTFVEFLKAYYLYLEKDYNVQEVFQNFKGYADIDKTIPGLIDNFFASYAADLPLEEITTNKPLFLKRVRDLYRNKGNEKGYDLLFRILYNETVDFFYPYNYVIRPSDGKIRVDNTVKLYPSNTSQNLFELENTLLVGSNTNASAIVTSVIKYNIGQYEVYEALLDEKSIKGEFSTTEQLYADKLISVETNSFQRILANAYPVIKSVDILDPGKGYGEGQLVTVVNPEGIQGKIRIDKVNDLGEIKELKIINSGLNYVTPPTLVISNPMDPVDATYKVKDNVLTIYFDKRHGLGKADSIQVEYYGNIYSPLEGITETKTISKVVNYKTVFYDQIVNDTSGNVKVIYNEPASLKAVLGTISKTPKYLLNNDGKISENMYLQGAIPDSDVTTPIFFQPYSYVIKSKKSISEWRNYAKTLVHPAGFALLGEVNIETDLNEIQNVAATSAGTSEVRDIFVITCDNKKPPFYASMTRFNSSKFPGGFRNITADFTYVIFGYLYPPPFNPALPSSLK
jgi:hypothetical protein